MLNERTQAKIGIINTDSKKIAAALLECIAPENLPPQYGGTCPLDLGESEEEADLRAYVARINGGPSSVRTGFGVAGEDEGEIEVDLRAKGSSVGGAAARVGGAAITRDTGLKSLRGHGGKPRREDNGDVVEIDSATTRAGAARRAFGSVRGALGWAGGKLAWRRSPVAHLGDENGFEYDAEQHRWVLRDSAAGGGGGAGRGHGGASGGAGRNEVVSPNGGDGKDAGERGRQLTDSRLERDRSVSSEEMTVLAIQVCAAGLVFSMF